MEQKTDRLYLSYMGLRKSFRIYNKNNRLETSYSYGDLFSKYGLVHRKNITIVKFYDNDEFNTVFEFRIKFKDDSSFHKRRLLIDYIFKNNLFYVYPGRKEFMTPIDISSSSDYENLIMSANYNTLKKMYDEIFNDYDEIIRSYYFSERGYLFYKRGLDSLVTKMVENILEIIENTKTLFSI